MGLIPSDGGDLLAGDVTGGSGGRTVAKNKEGTERGKEGKPRETRRFCGGTKEIKKEKTD